MATLRIHHDQENRVPDIRQKQTNVGRKRAVLGVIDSNKAQQNIQIIKTKQVSASCVYKIFYFL